MMLCPGKKTEPICVDGETKMDDCNTCHCANGVWACTMMFCGGKKEEPVCVDGETKMDDCNTCHCANGVWACTLMFCGGKKEEKSEVCIGAGGTRQCFPAKRSQGCTLGETKKEDCNTCACAGLGDENFWLCTMMRCPEKRAISVDGASTCISAGGTMQCFPSKKQEPECTDGDTKKEDCNTCVCNGGVWACTLMLCLGRREEAKADPASTCISAGGTMQCFPSKKEEPVCTDGDTKKVDCNDCVCSGGVWACTYRMCLGTWAETKRDESCTAGKAYKIDCNWCICDAGEWLCTLRTCGSNLNALTKRSEVGFRGVCPNEAVKYKDCNTCVCVDGEWMCTMRMCYAIGKREEATPVCADGDSKMEDCNSCACMGGQWACTFKMCYPPAPPVPELAAVEKRARECRGGQTKLDECNRCICLAGRWACTLKICV